MKKPSIFIGYRRADSADAAGRIFDRLEQAFGRKRIFKDVDDIPPGIDFRAYVREIIGQAEIFLLLIGPRWTEAVPGRRSRLWEPEDLVRIEIETALRSGCIVIPTLVSGAQMPKRDDLPPSIHPVMILNAALIRQDPDFNRDMSKLIAHLETLPTLPSGQPNEEQLPKPPLQLVKARPKGAGPESKPRVAVIGVGGAGGEAIATMIEMKLRGVDFAVMNTDVQALNSSQAEHRVQLGRRITQGLGSGSRPEIGAAAAEETEEQILRIVDDSDLIFLAAGMGGGTGAGAAPVIARLAKERGKTVVGIVTMPFSFEGLRRARSAERSLEMLAPHLDAMVVFNHQNLFRIADPNTTFGQVFQIAHKFLSSAIKSVVDLAVVPGRINLDFEDLIRFFDGFGRGKIGFASGSFYDDSDLLAQEALEFRLMGAPGIENASKAILNITSGMSLTYLEIEEISEAFRKRLRPGTELLVGSGFDETMGEEVAVSIFVNGASEIAALKPPSGDDSTAAVKRIVLRPPDE